MTYGLSIAKQLANEIVHSGQGAIICNVNVINECVHIGGKAEYIYIYIYM